MKRQTYTPEIKEHAVRILIEAKNDYPSTWSAIQALTSKIGYMLETPQSGGGTRYTDQSIPTFIQAKSNGATEFLKIPPACL